MTCHDAREALARGGMDLTGRALVYAHMTHCAECGKERAQYLQPMATSRQRAETGFATWLTQLRVRLSIALTASGHGVLRVVEVARAGGVRVVGLLAQMARLPLTFVAASGRAAANLVGHVRFMLTRFAQLGKWLWSSMMLRGAAHAPIEAARSGATRVLALLPRLRVRLSIALTASGHGAVRVVEVVRAGGVRAMGLLAQMGWLLLTFAAASGRAAANLIGRVRFVLTRFAQMGKWLGSSMMRAFQGAARATIEAARAGVTRVLALLPRLGVRLSMALTLSGHGAVRVVEVVLVGGVRVIGLLAQVGWLLLTFVAASGRAAANLIGRVRFALTRFAQLGKWLGWSVMRAFQGAARAMIEAARAGATRVLDLLPRLNVLLSTCLSVSVEAGGRVIAASRALSVPDARTSRLGPRKATTWPTSPLLMVSTGTVSLAVVVSVVLFSTGERLPHDGRGPADQGSTLAETSRPMPESAPQPVPEEVSRPETRRVVMRPKSPDPALAQSRAPAAALTPSEEGIQNGEASDPTAAIDWLLQGGRGRRRSESP